MRYLDQSWRLARSRRDDPASWRDEVILVGHAATLEGRGEDVLGEPASATRLWLGKVPGPGEIRPPLNGTVSQETFVRVYIPVAP
jgi:hypothetical protein